VFLEKNPHRQFLGQLIYGDLPLNLKGIRKSVELVKELMEKTKTSKGLNVIVEIIDKVYQTGRKRSKDFKKKMEKWCTFPLHIFQTFLNR
jgi:hypothetical protein